MLHVKFQNGVAVEVKQKLTDAEYADRSWQSRWDWNSFEQVEQIANQLSKPTEKQYLATDAGDGCFPRFDIIEAPAVGDPVSYGFNGDYYPDGYIAKISKKYMITTTNGTTYRRRGNSGSWKKPGGTWSLVAGHIEEQNPHF